MTTSIQQQYADELVDDRVREVEDPGDLAEFGGLSRSRFLARAGAFLFTVALVGRLTERGAFAHKASPPCGCTPSGECQCCDASGSCCSSGSQKCVRRFEDCSPPGHTNSGFWDSCCGSTWVRCYDYVDSDGHDCICGYYSGPC